MGNFTIRQKNILVADINIEKCRIVDVHNNKPDNRADDKSRKIAFLTYCKSPELYKQFMDNVSNKNIREPYICGSTYASFKTIITHLEYMILDSII
jgi:hypothetical protein